jgi:hypothetical protein
VWFLFPCDSQYTELQRELVQTTASIVIAGCVRAPMQFLEESIDALDIVSLPVMCWVCPGLYWTGVDVILFVQPMRLPMVWKRS